MSEEQNWETLSYQEKNHQLFLKQKELLGQFMERGAISPAQYEKSLRDLAKNMGEKI